MAIEIRELVIKTTVQEEKGAKTANSKNSADKEDIIQECIDKVVEMLKYEKER
jgi:hypothetical protein